MSNLNDYTVVDARQDYLVGNDATTTDETTRILSVIRDGVRKGYNDVRVKIDTAKCPRLTVLMDLHARGFTVRADTVNAGGYHIVSGWN